METKRVIMSIPALEDYPVLEAAMSSHDRSDALDDTADADVKQFVKLEILIVYPRRPSTHKVLHLLTLTN